MNKKLLRNIIIAIVAVAIMGAAYYFAMKWEPKKAEIPQTQIELSEGVSVWELDINNIKQLEFNNPSGTYVINNDGDSYSMPAYPNARLMQSRLGNPFTAAKRLVAIRTIEHTGNFGEFGLAEPVATIVVHQSEGDALSIFIGNPDPTNNGYYMKTSVDDTVYLISKSTGEMFLEPAEYYRNLSVTTFDLSNIKLFEIYKNDTLVTSIRLKNSSDTLQELIMDDLVMTYPYYEYVLEEDLVANFEGLTKIEAISVVSDTAADAAKYGVGTYTLKVTSGENNHILKLGTKDANGNVYAVYDGVDAVITIDAAWLSVVENFRPFDCLFKLVHVYNLDEVSAVGFASPQGTYNFNVSGSDDKLSYSINGDEVDERAFQKSYGKILEVRATGEFDNSSQAGAEIGSIVFKLADGNTHVFKYYEYDERSYLVVKYDGTKYLVLKKNFDSVYGDIEALLK